MAEEYQETGDAEIHGTHILTCSGLHSSRIDLDYNWHSEKILMHVIASIASSGQIYNQLFKIYLVPLYRNRITAVKRSLRVVVKKLRRTIFRQSLLD
jgi:hypothetical protein